MDFWRMVVEHNVSTMVVLSSVGECWVYWPDQEEKTREFGYIVVTHTAQENRVAYIKREFTVYNKKVGKGTEHRGLKMPCNVLDFNLSDQFTPKLKFFFLFCFLNNLLLKVH